MRLSDMFINSAANRMSAGVGVGLRLMSHATQLDKAAKEGEAKTRASLERLSPAGLMSRAHSTIPRSISSAWCQSGLDSAISCPRDRSGSPLAPLPVLVWRHGEPFVAAKSAASWRRTLSVRCARSGQGGHARTGCTAEIVRIQF